MQDGRTGRVPVPHETVRRIQEMISAGQVKPGERLPSQRTLSEQFNVSRTSLREALSVLETLGFVRIEAGRGAIVCAEGRRGAAPWRFGKRFPREDVFQLRMLLETYTARHAAARITPDHVRQLRANIAKMRAALHAQDLEASARLDLEFHRLIIDFAGNRMFAEIYEGLAPVILELHRLPLNDRARVWEPVTEHEQIVQALERNDPNGAAYYLSAHLIRTAGRCGISETSCSSW